MRLQKYLAECGVASRRGAEELILQGRVSVSGMVVTQMGVQVEEGDLVEVDGKRVLAPEKKQYILLYKPQGVVCTLSDPEGRKTVRSLLPEVRERIYPVGRLDYDTDGLLLLTNDGQLSNGLTHPSKEVEKVYILRVRGKLPPQALGRLEAGVTLEDGHRSAPAKVELLEDDPGFMGQQILRLHVHEGHNRLVRRMVQAVGGEVVFLKRERIGNLGLGHLRPGQWRHLSEGEVRYLKGLYTHDPA